MEKTRKSKPIIDNIIAAGASLSRNEAAARKKNAPTTHNCMVELNGKKSLMVEYSVQYENDNIN